MNDSTWAILEYERLKLAEYLADLSEAQWNTPSLCSAWQVRDVVAHLILESSYKVWPTFVEFLKAGGNPKKLMERMAIALGASPPSELIEQLRHIASVKKTPPGIAPHEALTDFYIHLLDIKIPLGEQTVLSEKQLLHVLKTAENSKSSLGAKIIGLGRRTKGLKFVATDVEWSYGDGAEVSGKAQDIILAVSGRKLGLRGLTGDGLPVLASRLVYAG